MPKIDSAEDKKIKNREAQRKYLQSKKGKEATRERIKKWTEKKKLTDPDYFKKYQKNRKEYLKEYHKKRREKNPEKIKKEQREAQKKYQKTKKGKESLKLRVKKWTVKKKLTDPDYFKKYQKNREEYFKEYRNNNKIKIREFNKKSAKKFYIKTKRIPKYIVLRALRGRLWDVMNSIKIKKNISSRKLLGCSINEFKSYIEKKFKRDMNWENYGSWHIDHIKPVSKFDLTNEDEQKRCFHYTNLQPLWAKENLQKSNKY